MNWKTLPFFWLFLILAGFGSRALGQSAPFSTTIEGLFKDPKLVAWKRYFKGRLDDLHDVSLLVGSDGKSCKGLLLFLRSKEALLLEGVCHSDRLLLNEKDSSGRTLSVIEGKVDAYVLTATWKNAENTLGKSLLLVETPTPDTLPTNCGDNKWIGQYVAEGTDAMELILQKGASNQLWGVAYYQNRSLKVSGDLDENFNLKASLRKPSGILFGNLAANLLNVKGFDASFTQEGKSPRPLRFTQKEQFGVQCLEYAGRAGGYDFSFPKTKNAVFNQWIAAKTEGWIAAWLSQLTRTAGQQQEEVQASGWCELELYSPDFISGFLSAQTSWGDGQQDMSFNFNLKKNEEIRSKDLFKDTFNPASFVKTVIKTAFKNHTLYETDEGFREWIGSADFPYFTLRKEGICFSTAFNPVYGRQSLTVPYSELRPYLRENTTVRLLMDL
jgi:hypothetical protein